MSPTGWLELLTCGGQTPCKQLSMRTAAMPGLDQMNEQELIAELHV
jgi:hypothetical protein